MPIRIVTFVKSLVSHLKQDFQRTAHSTLQGGPFTERYARQSKTVIKANTRVWESCRPVTPIFNYTNKTNREIGKSR